MGFLDSYRRLSYRQKIGVGVVGMLVGGFGPYAAEYINSLMDDALTKDEVERAKAMEKRMAQLQDKEPEKE